MTILKTYVVNNLHMRCLHVEVEESGHVSGFQGIQATGVSVEILGDYIVDEQSLDAVVSAHDGYSLESLKNEKILEIDTRTEELIAEGFVFDSNRFSLSLAAQKNWLGLKVLESLLTWPVSITTFDDGVYLLSSTKLTYFLSTGEGVVQAHLDSGRLLKTQVINAVDKTALAAIVDNR